MAEPACAPSSAAVHAPADARPPPARMLDDNLSGVPAFLRKTFALLSDRALADIVAWTRDGHSFVIHDAERFADEVCPTVFRHRNVDSFVRQLNLYGFHKASAKHAAAEYRHPSFVRDDPHLMYLITRRAPGVAPADDTARVAAVAARVVATHKEVAKLADERVDVDAKLKWFASDRQRMLTRLDAIEADTAAMRTELDAERALQMKLQADLALITRTLIANPPTPVSASTDLALITRPLSVDPLTPISSSMGRDAVSCSHSAFASTRKRPRVHDDSANPTSKRARVLGHDGSSPAAMVDAICELFDGDGDSPQVDAAQFWLM